MKKGMIKISVFYPNLPNFTDIEPVVQVSEVVA